MGKKDQTIMMSDKLLDLFGMFLISGLFFFLVNYITNIDKNKTVKSDYPEATENLINAKSKNFRFLGFTWLILSVLFFILYLLQFCFEIF